MNYRPSTLYQMLYYAQGMADSLKASVYIQQSHNGAWLQAVTADAVNTCIKTLAIVAPNKDAL